MIAIYTLNFKCLIIATCVQDENSKEADRLGEDALCMQQKLLGWEHLKTPKYGKD